MHKNIRFNRILVRYGGYTVIAFVGFLYILDLFSTDLSRYLVTVGSVLVSVGLFAGLCFGFCSVLATKSDKEIAANAGEKLFFATLCLALSGLAGLGALMLELSPPSWIWVWFTTLLVLCIKSLAILFLVTAGGAIIHAHDWLSELFMTRWDRRLTLMDDEEKKPPTEDAA